MEKEPSAAAMPGALGLKLVVGVYGVQGVGKSTLLAELGAERRAWKMVEGSEALVGAMKQEGRQGGLDEFKALNEEEKHAIREASTRGVGRDCSGVSVVSGHYAFPSLDGTFAAVFTEADADVFDVIIYLDDKSGAEVVQQRRSDLTRVDRGGMDPDQIQNWIDFEKAGLRHKCEERDTPFFCSSDLLGAGTSLAAAVEGSILQALSPKYQETEEASAKALTAAIVALPQAHCYLLIDGDRTLSPNDTAEAFFAGLSRPEAGPRESRDLSTGIGMGGLGACFKRHGDKYPFAAFLEAAMLYARIPEEEYQQRALATGGEAIVYQEWIALLESLPPTVHAVLVTSGNREVWQAALAKHSLRGAGGEGMSLIAGNRLGAHSYLVSAAAKGLVARELRARGAHVFAFGDSKVDQEMLQNADRAYIVVDSKLNRSLQQYIKNEADNARGVRQLLLGGFSLFSHPDIKVASIEALQTELSSGSYNHLRHFTGDRATQLLATKSRNALIQGPELQDVHCDIGRFLAEKFVGEMDVIDVPIPHVQGKTVLGVAIRDEKGVTIAAMMRAGEPLARGVYRVIQGARFVYHSPGNLLHVPGHTLILVDSVINSGKSIRDELGALSAPGGGPFHGRIFVVSDVMQQEASEALPREFPAVRFFALRVSGNKYTGSGGTDTGNRLFGTEQS